MMEQSPKEVILKRIRKALIERTPAREPNVEWEKDIYTWDEEDELAVLFVREFTAVAGKFIYCESEPELAETIHALAEQENWKNVYCYEPDIQHVLSTYNVDYRNSEPMDDADVSITGCEALVARFGSIIVSSAQEMGRQTTVYPPVHLVVAHLSQLAPDIKTAFHLIQERYKTEGKPIPSMLTQVTGASRTADIEKTLVMGAHGPKELYLLLLPD